jgi:hypothetical protein
MGFHKGSPIDGISLKFIGSNFLNANIAIDIFLLQHFERIDTAQFNGACLR